MKNILNIKLIFIILATLTVIELILCCNKIPNNIPYGKKKTGDNGYRLIVGDEPNGYKPGKIYNSKYNKLLYLQYIF